MYSTNALYNASREPILYRLFKGKLINLKITHQEITEVLNTTRVTVTRLLQQFEQEGNLLRYKRKIILHVSDNSLKNS